MAFPQNLMTQDEEVVEHLHPHWITLVPAVIWLVVVCALFGVGLAFLPDGSAHGPLLIILLVVAVVLIAWLCVKPFLSWKTTHYVITNERVLIRRGILRHSGRDIALARINDVGFVLTLWDRMVRAGTLTIESAGELGQERLVNIPHAGRVQQTLNHLIEHDADTRARRAYGAGAHDGT